MGLEYPYSIYLNLLPKITFACKEILFDQVKNADVTTGGCSSGKDAFGMYVVLGSIVVLAKKMLMYCCVPQMLHSILPLLIAE